MSAIHQSVIVEDDEDGFLTPVCSCGWRFGPVPDHETLTDVLMEHAYNAGHDAGYAGTPER